MVTDSSWKWHKSLQGPSNKMWTWISKHLLPSVVANADSHWSDGREDRVAAATQSFHREQLSWEVAPNHSNVSMCEKWPLVVGSPWAVGRRALQSDWEITLLSRALSNLWRKTSHGLHSCRITQPITASSASPQQPGHTTWQTEGLCVAVSRLWEIQGRSTDVWSVNICASPAHGFLNNSLPNHSSDGTDKMTEGRVSWRPPYLTLCDVSSWICKRPLFPSYIVIWTLTHTHYLSFIFCLMIRNYLHCNLSRVLDGLFCLCAGQHLWPTMWSKC